MNLSGKDIERFWSKVDKSGECWTWTASKVCGYGQFCVKSGERPQRAHRVSYVLAYGSIPNGLIVCHRCDNPSCVRPDHLFLGTPKDNTADMVRKGRLVIKHAKCEQHNHAKLTNEQVLSIRRKYATGRVSQKQLGAEYGVSQSNISKIIRGAAWLII